jgi:HK97 family phage portal protein
MSFILRMLGSEQIKRDPSDERWWGNAASQSTAGVAIDGETALKLSTVWCCKLLLSETIAALPLVVYRRLGEGGRERARSNPLYEVLHDRPNGWQTPAEFREMMTGHLLMDGNAYAKIVAGPRGFVDELHPVEPEKVQVDKLGGGRFRYRVTEDSGEQRPYNQEDIFHLRGPSKDGVMGLGVIAYAKESFGLGMAAERYGSRFFRNDSRPGGVLEAPNKLNEPAQRRLKSGWEAAHAGGNQHRVAVLEQGVTWKQIGIAPDQAQFLQTREFQAEDVCRWFRVPPHMVGLTSKATSWGSGIEQMSLGFVTYTLLPWLTRWQQVVARDLILAPDRYFAEFVLEALLKGDIGSRYNAYATAKQWGWMNSDEIRAKENMNPLPDGKGQIYLEPLNMSPVGSEAQGGGVARLQSGGVVALPGLNGHTGHYRQLVEEAAGRVVRKELAALRKAAARGDLRETAVSFYEAHAPFVAQVMRIGLDAAWAYVDAGRDEVLAEGEAALGDWETRRVMELVRVSTADLEISG